MAKGFQSDGDFWADKFMDLANLSVVALIFSQFITEKIYWLSIVFGAILYLLLLILSASLRKKK